MPPVIQLPAKSSQTAFNLKRWEEMCSDPELAQIEGRLETDRFGRIIMTPPLGYEHGGYQSEISFLLRKLAVDGRVSTECPVSTRDGVRSADVAWVDARMLTSIPRNAVCLPAAATLCIEVVSSSNSAAEMEEKRMLYFDAGAREVWLCRNGKMEFFTSSEGSGKKIERSGLFPDFPPVIHLS